MFEALILINNKLQQKEAAEGLLEFVMANRNAADELKVGEKSSHDTEIFTVRYPWMYFVFECEFIANRGCYFLRFSGFKRLLFRPMEKITDAKF